MGTTDSKQLEAEKSSLEYRQRAMNEEPSISATATQERTPKSPEKLQNPEAAHEGRLDSNLAPSESIIRPLRQGLLPPLPPIPISRGRMSTSMSNPNPPAYTERGHLNLSGPIERSTYAAAPTFEPNVRSDIRQPAYLSPRERSVMHRTNIESDIRLDQHTQFDDYHEQKSPRSAGGTQDFEQLYYELMLNIDKMNDAYKSSPVCSTSFRLSFYLYCNL